MTSLSVSIQVIDTSEKISENYLLGLEEGFPSGQRDQTVNLTAQPSEVRILPPPPVRVGSSSLRHRSIITTRVCGIWTTICQEPALDFAGVVQW